MQAAVLATTPACLLAQEEEEDSRCFCQPNLADHMSSVAGNSGIRAASPLSLPKM